MDDDEVEVDVEELEDVLLAIVAVRNAVELTEMLGSTTFAHLVDAWALEQQGSVGFSPPELQY